jgi:iron complex outermembrane recepter protein
MASYLPAKVLRMVLLGSVSGMVSMAWTSAIAQDQNAATKGDVIIPEIIVTAQKRAESIQDTPLSITALDTRLLEQSGIKDAQGLTAVVPNVAVRPFNNSIIVATRGISNENTSNLGDASLAFHVNGVYVGRPRAASALFYDVERVELLRGPQGTLYGRNSTAGALNVITKRPDTGTIAGGADISYGNYDAVTARGYINIPLSDSIAVRGSAYYAKHDGYAINNRPVPPIPLLVGPPPAVAGPNALITATNAANLNTPNIKNGDDDNEIAGRLSLLIRPSDSFNWVITGQYQKTDEVGQVRSIINTPQYFAVGGPGAGRLFLPQQQDPSNPRIYSLNTQPAWKVEGWDITSEMTYELSEAVDLTMVTGYRKDKSSIQVDAAGTENLSVVKSPGKAKQISNELRLASNDNGPLKWLLGAYYFDEDQDDSVFINNVGGSPNNVVGANTYISSSSLAFFGQATYSLTDALRLTGGARYTDDKKKRFGFTVVGPGVTVAPNPLPPGTSYTNSQSWNRFNWKVGVDYDIAPNALLYASYSTGYRAGGFNNSSEVAYDPEDIKAFEAGVKTDLLDRRLRFNLAAFHYNYQDLQVTSPREINGRIQAFTQNAASAKIWGFEIESIVKPSDNFSVDIAFGYLKTKFGDFLSIDNICTAAGLTVPPQFLPGCVTRQRFNPNGTPVLLPVSPAPGAPLGPVFDLQQVNYKGNKLANAPEITLNVGANWTLLDSDVGSLTLRGALRLVGESYLSEYNRGPDRVGSYAMSEARATYRSANKAFSVEAFAQNIGNKTVPGSISITASGYGAAYLPPRTYGIRVGYDF